MSLSLTYSFFGVCRCYCFCCWLFFLLTRNWNVAARAFAGGRSAAGIEVSWGGLLWRCLKRPCAKCAELTSSTSRRVTEHDVAAAASAAAAAAADVVYLSAAVVAFLIVALCTVCDPCAPWPAPVLPVRWPSAQKILFLNIFIYTQTRTHTITLAHATNAGGVWQAAKHKNKLFSSFLFIEPCACDLLVVLLICFCFCYCGGCGWLRCR